MRRGFIVLLGSLHIRQPHGSKHVGISVSGNGSSPMADWRYVCGIITLLQYIKSTSKNILIFLENKISNLYLIMLTTIGKIRKINM